MHSTESSKKIEQLIADFQLPMSPSNLYEPIKYILSLGGKRVRPVVAMQVSDCLGIDGKAAEALAFSIELFHNFTLVHDDIMDKAYTRRGHATVHTKWNKNIGILSGDAMLIEVYKKLLSIKSPHTLALIERFNDVATLVCEGQQYDMDFESSETVTEKDYLEMIRLKTAVLLGFSMESAAVLIGDKALANKLFSIGQNIGISFQIKDDVLDAFPVNDEFGKTVGGDIYAAKKTILYINLLAACSEEDKARLLEIYGFESRSDEEVAEIRTMMVKYKIPQMVNKVALDYQHKVESEVNELDNEDLKIFLRSFSALLLSRTV